ncbi:Hypothetical predicted protein [Olea europaea subsp. europaea]|uniref:Patellin-1-6 C-terminal GOLD domain-containing protein n=1 Tax=Olea europaea subsp. europaea TaxID=158383 RepID=A0A8S0S4N7_OLEEU|nr:Hypothetical predicted protein [Olea europaea subsp. europaea]
MEQQIQKLDFKPRGISTLFQNKDLKNTPGPSRKDLQLATRRAVGILYNGVEEIPVHHGGLRRENDPDFSTKDAASEITVKAGVTETIEIPAPEAGWKYIDVDLTMVGWDVNYKEEIVPTDEGSYNIIVKKGKKITWQEDSIRNSFRTNEAGKVVITIKN